MSGGRNLNRVVGWHPPAGLAARLDAEVARRGGRKGDGTRSEILNEALAAYLPAEEEMISDGQGQDTRPADAADR